MTLLPHSFAGSTSSIPLSYLDDNFNNLNAGKVACVGGLSAADSGVSNAALINAALTQRGAVRIVNDGTNPKYLLAAALVLPSYTMLVIDPGVELCHATGAAHNVLTNFNANQAPQAVSSIALAAVTVPNGYKMAATVTFSAAPTGFVVGDFIELQGDPNAKFIGIFKVSAVNASLNTVTLYLSQGYDTLPQTITASMTAKPADGIITVTGGGRISGNATNGGLTRTNNYNEHAIVFNNVTGLLIDGLEGWDTLEYFICGANLQSPVIRNIHGNVPKDGIHIYGPCWGNVEIDGVTGVFGDDSVIIQPIDGPSYLPWMPPYSGGSFFGGAKIRKVRPKWSKNTASVAFYPASGAAADLGYGLYGSYAIDNCGHEDPNNGGNGLGSSPAFRMGNGYVPFASVVIDRLTLSDCFGDISLDNGAGPAISVHKLVIDKWTNVVAGQKTALSINLGNIKIDSVDIVRPNVDTPTTVLTPSRYTPFVIQNTAQITTFHLDNPTFNTSAANSVIGIACYANVSNFIVTNPVTTGGNNNFNILTSTNGVNWSNTPLLTLKDADMSNWVNASGGWALSIGGSASLDVNVIGGKIGVNPVFNIYGTNAVALSGFGVDCPAGQALFVTQTMANVTLKEWRGAAKKQRVTPTTGGTVTLSGLTGRDKVIIAPAGTLAALTLAFPGSAVDGEVRSVAFTQAITALSVSGATVIGFPASVSAGYSRDFTYSAADSAWV